MQTFTPYADFEQSLRTLDLKRLGKQRVEVIQIVRALTVPGYAWSSHPAVLMWKGYEEALGRYGLTSCDGLDRARVRRLLRGDDHRRPAGVRGGRASGRYAELEAADALPPWLFDEALQRSHRSSLLRKDPEHYGPLFPPDTPRDLDYVWPVRSPAVIERERRKEEAAQRRAERTGKRREAEADEFAPIRAGRKQEEQPNERGGRNGQGQCTAGDVAGRLHRGQERRVRRAVRLLRQR